MPSSVSSRMIHTPGLPEALAATRMEALSWKSVVRSHRLTVEHAAVDIGIDRLLYHLRLELVKPLPETALQHTQFLCLTWPIGGLWKIKEVNEDRTKIECSSWVKTEMSHHEVEELAKKIDEFQDQDLPHEEDTPTLFEWKLMRGVWGTDQHHWFVRDINPSVFIPHAERKLKAKLFVGFAPLEAQLEVNAITAVDTVSQTISADVTWQVTVPGITAIREDSVLNEMLNVLEFDISQFEFTNISSMQEERELASCITPAGEAQFKEVTGSQTHTVVEKVYHLQYSRRVIATFTQEMTLQNFPFDQQKLSFDFSTGNGGMPEPLTLVPTPVTPGIFDIENYRLGNVFNVVFHDKVFVSDVTDSGSRKQIYFELVLERRSGYYVMNVALVAAIITYLSFVTWAPLDDGSLMDMGGRLQIVLTLLLTAQTFKNQVSSLLPQVSYFTSLDKYVFFCFLVTCAVTLENALFEGFADLFPTAKMREQGLLGLSVGAFTLVNVVWSLYITIWLDRRRRRDNAFLEVHELIVVVTDNFPAESREAVLCGLLEDRGFPDWMIPTIVVTVEGDMYLELPEDVPEDRHDTLKRIANLNAHKQRALTKLPKMKQIAEKMGVPVPDASSSSLSPPSLQVVKVIPATRPNAPHSASEIFQPQITGRRSSAASPGGRRSSASSPSYADTVVNVEPFHRRSEHGHTRHMV